MAMQLVKYRRTLQKYKYQVVFLRLMYNNNPIPRLGNRIKLLRLGSYSRTGVRVGGVRWVKGVSSLRVWSWNIGTLSGKSIELVKILKKRRINIACVQKTKWVGSRAKDVDEYKLWFLGRSRDRNGCLREKRRFWEDLDEMVRDIPPTEKLSIGGVFNGHIGSISRGYDDVHGGCGFGDRNGGGVALLDFAKAFRLVVANSSFPKKEEHLVTFCSSVSKTQIDFLLFRKGDRGLCKGCKVIRVRPNDQR
ncbi:uncharacterized protein LOC132062318 [Lycium ferocissimum]|uniref:uncharacterized protein LOC132062318 n=1 Tax=Lycium ferocissimum TaxID=112874 RepID=UPI002815BFBA|nr:uncharacterized protein LOC132062318 [Lycium ferocissimum]